LKSRQHGNPRIKAPLVMGHEFTGIVEEVSPTTSGFLRGDRIVMATSVSCGQCFYCRHEWRNLCVNLAPMGFSYPGGMADYVAIPALALEGGHAVKVPPHVEAKCAALAEPVSCAVNSVRQCGVQQGDTVLVMGAGPMGLLNALVARAAGASTILLSEPNPLRREQAGQFDLDRLIDPGADDITKIVHDTTDGRGADVVIVAAPAIPPQEQALSLVRRRGTVCLFASLPVGKSAISFDSRILHYGEIRLIGSSDSTPEHVHEAVTMIAEKQIPAEKVVSHCLPLDQIEQAFELMVSGAALRVVLFCR
jgi:L-iditol 2-dehydrogenase